MLSIIVSWCDRIELASSLESMEEVARSLKGEIIIVNYGGNHDQLLSLTNGKQDLILVDRSSQTHFNKARAQNIGASHARERTLFFCDCDILLSKDIVRDLYTVVRSSDKVFATVAGVIETIPNARQAHHLERFGYTLHLKTADGNELTIIDHEEDAETGARQAPGLLIVNKEHFVAIRGYNGGFEGWGWEDQDMIARLTLKLGLFRHQSGIFKHISHDDAARVARYPQTSTDRWESRDKIFRKALANYDANMFDGTLQEDAAE